MKMNKKIKDMQSINVFNPKSATVSKHYYDIEEVDQTLGKINNHIQLYRCTHHIMPIIIIISKELEILLLHKYELASQRQCIMINNIPVHVILVFGIACIVSPELHDLEFEVR